VILFERNDCSELHTQGLTQAWGRIEADTEVFFPLCKLHTDLADLVCHSRQAMLRSPLASNTPATNGWMRRMRKAGEHGTATIESKVLIESGIAKHGAGYLFGDVLAGLEDQTDF
jgi:hypothetical protein